MCRFVSGTLGSTVFGLILQGHVGGIAAGFGLDLAVLVGLAAVAVLAALELPGRHSDLDSSSIL
jgi:hypothetical protein